MDIINIFGHKKYRARFSMRQICKLTRIEHAGTGPYSGSVFRRGYQRPFQELYIVLLLFYSLKARDFQLCIFSLERKIFLTWLSRVHYMNAITHGINPDG